MDRDLHIRKTPALAYLANPIDQASKHDQGLWESVAEAKRGLVELGYMVYHPAAAWCVGGPMDRRLQDVNMLALEKADFVFVLLPPAVPTIGVPFEMGWVQARGSDTRGAVVCSDPGAMLEWQQWPVYGSVEDALQEAAEAR